MSQYPKPEVRDRIRVAALRAFAEHGYREASMADIARAAEVSAGNLYRYFPGKEALFEEAVPDGVVRTLLRLLYARVHALSGISEDAAGVGSRYARASEELLAFCVEHRLRVVVALGRAEDTPYAGLSEEVVHVLVDLAVAHFRALRPELEVGDTMRFDLVLIYRAYLRSLVEVLRRYEDEAAIRRAVGDYARYHLAGLQGFFRAP